MEMHNLIAIVCLVLLILLDTASAQRANPERITYLLTISHHPDIKNLSAEAVDKILIEASNVLKTCNVAFKRKGVLRAFGSDKPTDVIKPLNKIGNEDDRDIVHGEQFDVKIVQFIGFCRESASGGYRGCAWDPSPGGSEPQKRSMIIKRAIFNQRQALLGGVIFAHEFGHRTGLWHRDGENVLMSPCVLEPDDVQIDPGHECDCFRKGPGGCSKPEPNPPAACRRGVH
jgi:hypothetical protein